MKRMAPCTVMTEEEICERLLQSGISRVTLTGGEPMIAKNIDVLLERLSREESLEVEIETNGSVSLTAFRQMKRPPSFTIDYKLAGSGMETKMCMDNFAEVVKQDTVKFVVSGRSDLERAYEVTREYHLEQRCMVILSPVFAGSNRLKWLIFFVKNDGMEYGFNCSWHKFIWDPDKRGVLRKEDGIMAIDTEAINVHVRGIIEALGDDPDREGLKRTPDRVALQYEEVFEGMNYTNHEIAQMFNKTFTDRMDLDRLPEIW